jgi:enoyl-CoA hydratase
MIEELDHAFAVANADDEVRVIILAAVGDPFSSGHNLGTQEEKEDNLACC